MNDKRLNVYFALKENHCEISKNPQESESKRLSDFDFEKSLNSWLNECPSESWFYTVEENNNTMTFIEKDTLKKLILPPKIDSVSASPELVDLLKPKSSSNHEKTAGTEQEEETRRNMDTKKCVNCGRAFYGPDEMEYYSLGNGKYLCRTCMNALHPSEVDTL